MSAKSLFQEQLKNVIEANDDDVAVDLGDVSFIDSTGLAVLVHGRQQLQAAGRKLLIVGRRVRSSECSKSPVSLPCSTTRARQPCTGYRAKAHGRSTTSRSLPKTSAGGSRRTHRTNPGSTATRRRRATRCERTHHDRIAGPVPHTRTTRPDGGVHGVSRMPTRSERAIRMHVAHRPKVGAEADGTGRRFGPSEIRAWAALGSPSDLRRRRREHTIGRMRQWSNRTLDQFVETCGRCSPNGHARNGAASVGSLKGERTARC